MPVIGWDIGGVNTKVARVSGGHVASVRSRPYELQHAPAALTGLLRELASEVGAAPGDAHAVTMTAELSQMFRTKREGVAFVLDAVTAAFGIAPVHVFTVDGTFADCAAARAQPLAVAAANWAATATLVARHHPDALLIDVGTTTTDIIPIVNGIVVSRGRTDPERLGSGELVYSGAVRTPVEALVSHVPLGRSRAGVSAEAFALIGDVYVWRGELDVADYTTPTPDRRPVSREHCGERLARVVCADREILDEAAISAIAEAVATAQKERIASTIGRVRARHPSLDTAVVTGLGSFIGVASARMAGLDVVPLSSELGDDGARCAPAASVALLLENASGRETSAARARVSLETHHETSVQGDQPHTGAWRPARVDAVVKIGGSLLAHMPVLDRALQAIRTAARRIAIVPGGGPFADAVRDVNDRVQLSDTASHWMAVLGMDQYAHLLAARLDAGVLVSDPDELAAVLDTGRVAVLAPSRWLMARDPLPHSWDVTSDSIAAWIAGELGASRLVLLKAPGATGPRLVDAYFELARPVRVEARCVAADRLDELLDALNATQ